MRLNFRLLQLPPELMRHVVAHELVSGGVQPLAPRFWAIVGQLDANAKAHKRAIKNYAVLLGTLNLRRFGKPDCHTGLLAHDAGHGVGQQFAAAGVEPIMPYLPEVVTAAFVRPPNFLCRRVSIDDDFRAVFAGDIEYA